MRRHWGIALRRAGGGSRVKGEDTEELLDAVVIGAGPAGLTALIYLTRFHRRALAFGGGGPKPRLLLIDRSYNLPGYPDGASGAALLERLREQAAEMEGEIRDEIVERVEGSDGDFRIRIAGAKTLRSRKVILAMGVRDREPDIPGIGPHIGEFVRYCPVCDGYEHSGKRLGILGCGPEVAQHALFLKTFSNEVSLFLNGADPGCLAGEQAKLEERGVTVHQPRIVRILDSEGDPESEHPGCGVVLEDGSQHPLAVLYGALGCDVNLSPIRDLGIKLDDEGYVVTNMRQETSVRGIYAAGDIASAINQISVAFGQAAIAAVELHNALAEEEGLCD